MSKLNIYKVDMGIRRNPGFFGGRILRCNICSLYFFTLSEQPQGLVSFSFFLLLILSVNMVFAHISLLLILTKLGYMDKYLIHYAHTNNDGVKGHDGGHRGQNISRM